MPSLKEILSPARHDSLNKELLAEYNSHRAADARKYLCHAPFKSIYFGHGGRAVACCYNRSYVLGEYPARSVKDIWWGAEADRLRDYIKHNDLSLGCFGCRQQITARNFDAVKARQYDERRINRNHYPSVMEFELSNVCNLECEMCSGEFSSLIRAKREKLPPIVSVYDAGFVEQLEEFIPFLEEVKFYGGEPFLIDIYYDIWERIMRINPAVRISVQTNATVLNNRVKNILEHTNFHINISLDSLQKETYESIRKNAVFERVMENLDYFYNYCKAKNTFFGISVCAMRQNWRELPAFINRFNTLDVPVYFHTVLDPYHLSLRSMKPEELSEAVKYLQGFDFPAGSPIQQKNRTHYFDFLNQLMKWRDEAGLKSQQAGAVNGMGRLKTLSELRIKVAEHIAKAPAFTEKEKRDKTKKVGHKITRLEAKLDPVMLSAAMARYDFNDPLLLDSIVYYFDHLPMPLILALAKSVVR